MFADGAVMASAALDRLLHRSTVITVKGDSYRLANRRKTGNLVAAAAAPTSRKE